MARRARIVLPGFPHHVTQRGNRRQQTFFEDADYALYRDLMAAACATHGVRCWAWCLMPNHVHLVLLSNIVPYFMLLIYFLSLHVLNSGWLLLCLERLALLNHRVQDTQ